MKKNSKDIFTTLTSKISILILNFLTVILSIRLWGAEGRGYISLFIADLSMVSAFTNVFTSSSVSFFISRLGKNKLMSQAYCITFFITTIISIVLSLSKIAADVGVFLFFISTLLGFVTFHNSVYIGKQKINYFNLITVLQPLLLIIFMISFHLIFKTLGVFQGNGYFAYFYGQALSLIIIVILCHLLTKRTLPESYKFELDRNSIKASFSYGWQTELSNLLQFFNYRLSYYFLQAISGVGSVGIFSTGVMITEAVWTVSKSISVVQYSNVLKQGDSGEARSQTLKMALVSLIASTACLSIVLLLPKSLFVWVFGEEFATVKRVLLLMTPGVLAIATSNVFGNYFSAIGKLKILIAKSAIGLLATVVLSIVLIPRFHVDGACIVNATSYIVSSVIIVLFFFKGNNRRQ